MRTALQMRTDVRAIWAVLSAQGVALVTYGLWISGRRKAVAMSMLRQCWEAVFGSSRLLPRALAANCRHESGTVWEQEQGYTVENT